MNRRGFLAFLIAAPVTKALPWEAIAKFIEPVAPAISAKINLTLSELISATIKARMPDLVRNITANNALLKRLQDKDHLKMVHGRSPD